jgi:glucose-1-phosphate adenylyltransferase
VVNGASIRNSIVRREVFLDEDVEVEDSIVMDYAVLGRGVKLRRVIVDRYNIIQAGTRIGYDLEEDRKHYHVTDSGIVVVPKGKRSMELVY